MDYSAPFFSLSPSLCLSPCMHALGGIPLNEQELDVLPNNLVTHLLLGFFIQVLKMLQLLAKKNVGGTVDTKLNSGKILLLHNLSLIRSLLQSPVVLLTLLLSVSQEGVDDKAFTMTLVSYPSSSRK